MSEMKDTPAAAAKPFKPLSPKEKLFAILLSCDPKRNATKAVQGAGWKQSDAAAAVTASRLLRKANVKAVLDEELAKQAEKFRKNGAYIVARMFEAEGFDLSKLYDQYGHVLPMDQWPAGAGTLVESIRSTVEPQYDLFKKTQDGKPAQVEKLEVRLPSRRAMWELLGRHFGIFNDSLELKGGGLAERLQKARQRAAK